MSSRTKLPDVLHNLFSEVAEKAGFEFRWVYVRCQMLFVLLWGVAIAAAQHEQYGIFVVCVIADFALLAGLMLYQKRGLGPFRVSISGSWLSRLGISKEYVLSTRVYPAADEAYNPLPRRLVYNPEGVCEADIGQALCVLAEEDADFGRWLLKAAPQGLLNRYAATNLTVFYVATRLTRGNKA